MYGHMNVKHFSNSCPFQSTSRYQIISTLSSIPGAILPHMAHALLHYTNRLLARNTVGSITTQYKHNTIGNELFPKIAVFWVAALCSMVESQLMFRYESTMLLRNIDDLHKTTRRHVPKDVSLYSQRRETPKLLI
jgi:hypothetical protein